LFQLDIQHAWLRNSFWQAAGQNELERAFAAARRYSRKSRAKSTWRAYESDWQQFESWCGTVALATLPADPDTIAMFVASQAASGLSPSTLTRRLAAIRLSLRGRKTPRQSLHCLNCAKHNSNRSGNTTTTARNGWGMFD